MVLALVLKAAVAGQGVLLEQAGRSWEALAVAPAQARSSMGQVDATSAALGAVAVLVQAAAVGSRVPEGEQKLALLVQERCSEVAALAWAGELTHHWPWAVGSSKERPEAGVLAHLAPVLQAEGVPSAEAVADPSCAAEADDPIAAAGAATAALGGAWVAAVAAAVEAAEWEDEQAQEGQMGAREREREAVVLDRQPSWPATSAGA